MLALLQETNILNNIYIKQVNKYNVNKWESAKMKTIW